MRSSATGVRKPVRSNSAFEREEGLAAKRAKSPVRCRGAFSGLICSDTAGSAENRGPFTAQDAENLDGAENMQHNHRRICGGKCPTFMKPRIGPT